MESRLCATRGPSTASLNRNPVDEAGFRSYATVNTTDDLALAARQYQVSKQIEQLS